MRDLWLEALRSGEYEQGHGQLRDGDSFCCLGVLCALHAEQTREGGFCDGVYVVYGAQAKRQYPPDSVEKWADLSAQDGRELWHRNDGNDTYHRHSFAEIADYIEEYL